MNPFLSIPEEEVLFGLLYILQYGYLSIRSRYHSNGKVFGEASVCFVEWLCGCGTDRAAGILH